MIIILHSWQLHKQTCPLRPALALLCISEQRGSVNVFQGCSLTTHCSVSLAQKKSAKSCRLCRMLGIKCLTTCDIGSQLCNMVHLYTVTSTSSIVISVAHMAHICHVTVDNGENSFPSQPYSL